MNEDQPSSSPLSTKVIFPTIAMVITFAISTYLASRGVMLPPGIQEAVTGLIATGLAFLVGYLVPLARSEIRARMTNDLVAEANADPTSPVDLAKIVDDETIVRAQLDPEAPATVPEGETKASLLVKLAEIQAEPADVDGGKV